MSMTDIDYLAEAGERYARAIGHSVKVSVELWAHREKMLTWFSPHEESDFSVWTVYGEGLVFSSHFQSAWETLKGLRIKTLLHRKVAL